VTLQSNYLECNTPQATIQPQVERNPRWHETAYRRSVVDMHISDWDESFLSEFDARKYVEMLTLSQVQSAVIYAHSHVGLCYFPTKVGLMHPGLKGRNVLAETIDLCHQKGISVVVYYSLIFDTWAYRHHPHWRIVGPDGRGVADQSRYGVCCPNSPYRDYVVALIEEICRGFDFEGIRFDMTFWPHVCYCRHCRRRFAEEAGGELPQVVHWEDPVWVAFQRKREEWLVEFASLATSTVKRLKPAASVEHQASTYANDWRFGVTYRLAEHNDFLQGDFYGDALAGSFARKVFQNLSRGFPPGFETSIGADLKNYTALKPRELLLTKACAALADGCAFIFIDSIEPTGVLNRTVYERMGSVFNETKVYEPYLGGKPCQDVAIYLSTESKCDFADNGKRVDAPNLSARIPHVEAALSVAKSLRESHIPFGVITKRNLADLARYQIVILPNVLMMDEEEAQAFRAYVRGGGALYASKYSSLITKDGRRQHDFLLADVFGISFEGETQESYTYIAPATGAEELFAPYTARHPLGLGVSQMRVTARPGAKVLATLTLPYTDPADPVHFASIHNDPPGRPTRHPALVLNRFGQGQAMYVAGDLESFDFHREIFIRLIRLLARSFAFEADAPKAVEVTLFHQEDRRRFIINLVNFQKELPNIPVEGIRVKVRLDGKNVRRVLILPMEKESGYTISDGYAEFTVPRLETFAMLALDYC
jgi:hypothetical protein